MNEKSIYELFQTICQKNQNSNAFSSKKGGQWEAVTWGEHERTCRSISKSLMALGIEHADKVNILSNTRLEWVQCDMGTVNIGAVTVGIYAANLAEDCAYIINHSDAKIVFVENYDQLQKVESLRDQMPGLQHIVLFDGHGKNENGIMGWDDFMAKGNTISDAAFEERAAETALDDLAAIVYTSGTTGVPKGAMITHENLLFTSWSVTECLEILPGYKTLLFLPLAHVFARILTFFSMRGAVTVYFAESIETIGENLKEVQPDFFASVPRIYEKVYDKITSGAKDAGGLKEKIFNWALATGMQVSALQQQNEKPGAVLGIKNSIADKLVFSKIKAAMGGRVIWAISGAAPLNKTIAEFFHACGILVLEGIGMTENTSFTNVNRPDKFKFGTVGQPGPGIEQAVAADGEVLYRGKNVMKGYFKAPEETAKTIDENGWLYTGDIGEIDADGFLKITDRKKDLIITAGGKNIAPQRIEKIIRTSRYISQVVAYGDKKKFCSALITVDQPQVEAWAIKKGLDVTAWKSLCESEEIKKLIFSEVQDKNKELSSYETLKKIIILPEDFTIEAGELTASMKIKRKVVIDRHKQQLEALYDE